MAYNEYGIKTRVLFTGLGIRTIGELMEKVTGGYETEKCLAKNTELLLSLTKFQPHAIVICLQNELVQELKTYYTLAEAPEYEALPVIIVGKDAECEMFRNEIAVSNLTAMGRPLNVELFLAKLDALTEGATDDEIQAFIKKNEVEALEQSAAEEAGNNGEAMEILANDYVSDDGVVTIEKKCILVVDDDVLMLNTIKAQLQDMYDVTVVPNGKLALKFLAKKHADLVLLDYLMPDMNGPDVFNEIRRNSPNPDVPVIFLTGVADRGLVMKSLELLPDGYLLKPVSREALLERVAETIIGL